MENDKVPYLVYEGTQARFERTNKRLWVLCIILIAVTLLSNLGWFIYESQFLTIKTDETTVTQEAESDTGDIIQNNSGELSYGN